MFLPISNGVPQITAVTPILCHYLSPRRVFRFWEKSETKTQRTHISPFWGPSFDQHPNLWFVSLKLTANAPENWRQKAKRRPFNLSSSFLDPFGPFSGAKPGFAPVPPEAPSQSGRFLPPLPVLRLDLWAQIF